MPSIKLSDKIYSVGVLNPNLRVFDIVMETKFGTSYNAYIIKGEKNVLIETCHAKFNDEFLSNIKEVINPEEIDYIILNHTEPDHSGALKFLTSFNKNVQIYCSQAASLFLKNITNDINLNFKIVQDNELLEIGNLKFKFIIAPFLHWPDSMFTYFENENVLFSCDFFGSHYCEPRMIDKFITDTKCYKSEFENYFNAIFGPFKTYVLKGLEKIKDLSIDMICPSHGPCLTKNSLIPYVIEKYNCWSVEPQNEVLQIPIFYCTAYGNTKIIAEKIKQGIKKQHSLANVCLYNLIENDIKSFSSIINSSDGFLVGTPTLNKDALPPVWELLSLIDAVNFPKKPCGVFGSFGWSGEGPVFINERLKSLRGKVIEPILKIQFTPNDVDLANAENFGVEFAKLLD